MHRERLAAFMPAKPALSLEELQAAKLKEEIKEAVTMIQKHERARQARLYYFELDADRKLRDAITKARQKPQSIDVQIAEGHALHIQNTWKGYEARAMMKRRERERRLLIGMTEPSWKSTAERDKFEETLNRRRALRDQRIKEYVQANLAEKDRVLRVIGPGLMEDIGDEIRYYFHRFYRKVKAFDNFPTEEQGGSILIVRGETMTPEEWGANELKKVLEKSKEKKKDKKAEAEAKKKQKEEEKARKKKEKEQAKKEALKAKKAPFEFKFKNTPARKALEDGLEEYKETWDEINDLDNPTETHYMDMITDEKCYEMQMELRPIVDELMRIELQLLRDAIEYDKWKARGKKGRPKSKKKKGKNKKKKKRPKKDMTANRTTEDLFQELVDNGIIHSYTPRRLEEYRGDYSYKNQYLRKQEFDPPATLGDVRQVVALNCIMPLGVQTMARPRSVLIAGARQSGKHLLANAIFTETQCVLFDLSPPILAGKYNGKKDMKMLVHLINKMSRILQPSIIFIDGAEKPFYKKVPKEEKALEPKKMGKILYKGIVKTITPEDRVLVLGISGKPFAAKAKPLKKAFEKVILIPRSDYGSVMLYWREILMPYHGVDREINVTALTKVTVNFPLSQLKQTAETVLTPKRLVQLSYRPLRPAELYEAILMSPTPEPVTDKEYKKFVKWYNKYPIPKKRMKMVKAAEMAREAEKARLAKQKK